MENKDGKEAVIWTILLVIATVFRFLFSNFKTLKERAVQGLKNRQITKEKKAAQRKAKKDETRKKRIGTSIDSNDPWSGLSS